MQLGWDLSILVGPARLHLDTQRVTPPPGARLECELEREREKERWIEESSSARAQCHLPNSRESPMLRTFHISGAAIIPILHSYPIWACLRLRRRARTQPDRDVSPAEFAFRTLLHCANQKSEMRPRDKYAISGRSCNWIRRRAPYIINSLSAAFCTGSFRQ